MSKYYQRKQEWVKAWQYDGLGKTNMPEWVLELEEESGTNFSLNKFSTFIMHRGNIVDKNSWFVVDEFEDPFILVDSEFRDTFEVGDNA